MLKFYFLKKLIKKCWILYIYSFYHISYNNFICILFKEFNLFLKKIKEIIFSVNISKLLKTHKKEEKAEEIKDAKNKEIIEIESKEKKEKAIEDFKIKLNIMNENNIINNEIETIKDDNKK